MINKIKNELPGYKGTILIDGDDYYQNQVFDFKSLLTTDHRAQLPEISPDDIDLIPFSLGTSGLAKGLIQLYENLVSNLVQSSHPSVNKNTRPEFGNYKD